MLNFNMETVRINEIINRGAADRMNDIQFLEKEVQKFLDSPQHRWMVTGTKYYSYDQDVLRKKRMVIGENGDLFEDKQLPNNKYIDNQYAKMVDQKVNYLLSKPITFNSDNESYVEALNQIFNKKFHRTLKNLGKDAYNGGIAWLYPYYDEIGNFKIKKFHPWEVLPFWKDEEHTELDFAVRVYQELGYKGQAECTYTFVEVYDTNGIHKFAYENGHLTPDYSTYYFEVETENEMIPYNWERVPLIPFKCNNEELPLIQKCKSLQDGINFILSSFGDGMEENASGSSILIIKNYDGQDLGHFRRNLATYKAVKVRTVDGADGGIDSLQIEVNAENYKAILVELRKALIKNCSGYDVEELKSSGSPNEMTIKSVYSDIDLDANEIETEFQASFEDLLWFINQHFKNTGTGDFETAKLDVIFNRDMLVNESDVIQSINNSSGILSQETLVSQHPWVDDVKAELDRLKKEKEENMEQFGNMDMFNNPPVEKDGEENEDS